VSDEMRNYYHDQASLMMFDRHVAPWQLCYFAMIGYLPVASIWSLDYQNMIGNMFGSAILATYTFYNFDMISAKFLLYTWHDNDPLYAGRTDEVPCGSSYWVMTYGMGASLMGQLGYSLLVHFPSIPFLAWLVLIIIVFIPIHLLPFLAYDATVGEIHISPQESVWIFCVVSVIIWFLSGSKRLKYDFPPKHAILDLAVIISFAAVWCMVFFADPTQVISTSIHQPFTVGATCNETETYYWGSMTRRKYICPQDMDARGLWKICGEEPQAGAEWYTICGTPMSQSWFNAFTLNLVAAIVMHFVLRFFRPSLTQPAKDKEA